MKKTREEIALIVGKLAFKGSSFRLLDKGDGYLLQLEYWEEDVHTGKSELQRARKWYISPWMTETEIVETAYAACQRSMMHRLGEWFSYQGKRVYSPHFPVEARLAMAEYDDDGRK
jgi:hypothetical protein